MNLIDKFFVPIDKIEGISKADHKLLANYVNSLAAISRMVDLSYYIIDYKKQGFIYVSNHPLFLAGYERKEVLELGYNFFARVVPAEDLNMLLEINEKGFGYYYNLPAERRPNGYISYDFRITHKNGSIILINHKLTPLILNKEGNLWISLCLVTLSMAKTPGNMFILMQDEGVKYNYNFRTKLFSKAKSKKLTQIGKNIIQLLSLGHSTEDISHLLHISINTVKFHKKTIFNKLNVKNSNEAVYMAAMHKEDL
ncbi:MAG: helix-turn-helix transcriptional regulator [Bacteroidales bacterium]